MIGILEWDIRSFGTTLAVISGSISIDDQNIPAITASVVVPYDEELSQKLDPRQTPVPRVLLNGTLTEWASQTLGDVSAYFIENTATTLSGVSALWSGNTLTDVTNMFGRPLHALAQETPQTMSLDLHVREIDDDGFEMTISLASDEALLTDWAPTSGQDMIMISDVMGAANPQQAASWINPFLTVVLGYQLTPGPYDTSALSDTYTNILDWSRWSSAWDMFRPVLEDTDLKLRVRPSGRGFTLERPENPINSPADHSWLFTDEDVTKVRHVRSRSGDWYDSALLTTAEMAGGTTVGSPSPGTHSRTYIETVPDTFKPSPSMAQNIVRRAQNRGQFIDIEAPIQLGVFMRDEFTYVHEIGDPDPEQWIAKAVSYDLTAGTMNIRGEQRY